MSLILVLAAAVAAPAASMPAMDGDRYACPAAPAALPPELGGWRRMVPVAAGASASAAAPLAVGVGVRAALRPSGQIAYAVALTKPAEASSHGGLFAIRVTRAGRYRVALGSAAWVDVARGDTALRSVAHAHGPACSGVRKLVDFDLAPGRYLLQISDNWAPAVGVMVVALH